MKHKTQFLLCAAVALTLVAPAHSSAQGGQGQGQRQGGAQRQGGGRGMSGLMLLMMPEVQKELKITAAQKTSIEKSLSSMMPRGGQGGQGGQRPTQGQQGQRPDFAAMEKKVTGSFSAQQKARYEELKLQSAGPNAFSRPEVATKLGLNDKQKKAIEASLQKARPNFNRQGGQQGGQQMDFEKLRKEMEAKRATAMKEILARLTAAQKTTWTKMTGKPFTFPRMQMRMGGGGRPGGGGGAAGGGGRGGN